ncbi:MAG: amidoligase family protein, partial [Bdellovibrionales bacterium]|nr:amidoligase family protein [Bdellovibrionales bacterium]
MKHARWQYRYWVGFLALTILMSGTSSFGVDILDTAETIFYRPGDTTRMGLEVELTGLSPEQVAKEVQSKLGGRIEESFDITKTNITGHDAQGLPIYGTMKTPIFVLKGSKIGDLVLKPDYNQITDSFDAEEAKKSVVTEIVTTPIRMAEVEKLQETLTHLKSKGAIGTTPQVAVATQVNVEWMGGGENQGNWKPADLVNLMRSYTRPEHRAQIDPHLQVPANRAPYLELFSKGFMKKLLDPSYKPTFRQFYDDYIYRQSLEHRGVKDAWTMPVEEARKKLISMGDEAIVPQVVKQNPIRISSLLMHLFPKDHMSKLYDASGWAKARPLIEFREWNNDFTCVPQAKQALGLVEGAKRYGYYDHDKLLASISTMDQKAIQDLRESVNRSGRNGKSVFRYYLGDPKTVDRSDYQEQSKSYKVGNIGFLPYGEHGQAPVKIPGESVVFHRRPMHRFSVEGKYNPGLINHNISQAMENKYVEALFWQKYAPGTMPETKSLGSFEESRKPQQLVERLNRDYPKGWVLKGAWDLGSEKDIITEKTDIVGELKKYDPVAFEKRRQQLLKKYQGYGDVAPEYLQSELKKDPGYKGWRLSKLLEDPELVMVQKKVPIRREFRVEVVSGKVLGGGSTVDRFKYMYEIGADGLKMKDYRAPSAEDFKKVEAFAQKAVNRLPPELRGMPYGMDIAILENGKMAMIESNPGGNS